jgi:hypothetical protein
LSAPYENIIEQLDKARMKFEDDDHEHVVGDGPNLRLQIKGFLKK